MDVLACINNRRSVRVYEDRSVLEADMDELIALGTKAATGSGMEPWGFVVLNDKEEIDAISEEIKAYLKEHIADFPQLEQYAAWLTNPKFHVFNRASTVLIIYGDKASYWRVYDCSMVAANISLAGYAMGIGSCWIGFAHYYFDTPAFKQKHHVPENYELICPLSMGYMKSTPNPPKRKEPVIFSR